MVAIATIAMLFLGAVVPAANAHGGDLSDATVGMNESLGGMPGSNACPEGACEASDHVVDCWALTGTCGGVAIAAVNAWRALSLTAVREYQSPRSQDSPNGLRPETELPPPRT